MIPKKMRNHNVVKFSLDGETFTKFEDNPVIPKPEEWKDFRDPRVRFKLMIVYSNSWYRYFGTKTPQSG